MNNGGASGHWASKYGVFKVIREGCPHWARRAEVPCAGAELRAGLHPPPPPPPLHEVGVLVGQEQREKGLLPQTLTQMVPRSVRPGTPSPAGSP